MQEVNHFFQKGELRIMMKRRIAKGTALFIAVVQIILGLGYLLAPAPFHASLGLHGLPDWAGWPMGMSGARFLAFGFGMILVFRNPATHRSWIQAMIFVQAIDWLVTMYYVFSGAVTLAQVSTASFLPLIFILALAVTFPKKTSEKPGR